MVHGRQVSFRCRRRDGHVVFIAATTLPTLFYLVQKYTDTATAFAAIDQLTAAADIVEVNRATIVAARAMPGRDFEENVQISCAVATGAGAIVTRDPADFANSPVRVMSPVELLVILRSQ